MSGVEISFIPGNTVRRDQKAVLEMASTDLIDEEDDGGAVDTISPVFTFEKKQMWKKRKPVRTAIIPKREVNFLAAMRDADILFCETHPRELPEKVYKQRL